MRTYLFCVTLFCVIRYIQSQGIFGREIIDYKNYFYSKFDNIEANTEAPLNIESDTAIPVDVPPFNSVGDYTERLILRNDGYILEAEVIGSNSSSYITGGILGKEIYQFHKLRFFFNNDYERSCANTLDGRGSNLQIYVQYFKKQYQTFENAYKNYRDGIFNVVVNVDVEGNLANEKFNEFESLLYQITQPNSTVRTTNGVVGDWWVRNNPEANCFSAYGSYYDFQSGKTYYTSFGSYIASGVRASISIFQFNAFRQLLNYGGSPLNPSFGTFPQGKRVIIQSRGVTVEVLNGPPAESH